MKPSVKNLRVLLHFMEERQRIYIKKQQGEPWPWTKDPILQRFKFCNTYREQDKETVWLREHWREPYAIHPNLWFACAMFRVINWSPSLEEIGFPARWNPERVARILEARSLRRDKVYTSAYMLRGGNSGPGGKPRHTVFTVLDPLWHGAKRNPPPWNHLGVTLREAWEWLHSFPEMGPFLAYECITDLRHTRYLNNAPDIMTWANAGPGAKRGLNRLYNRPLMQSLRQDQACDEMQEILAWLKSERDPNILPVLEMRDVEHCLCETDKMLRAKERIAQGRNCGLEIYKPPTKQLCLFPGTKA